MSTARMRCCAGCGEVPCDPGDPCKVLTATVCVYGEGECAPPPTYEIVVGPGSTAVVSVDAIVMQQDLRVYEVTGTTMSPIDPGNFSSSASAGDCEWDHPFTPPTHYWGRGRKVCKTLVRMPATTFAWEFDAIACAWNFVAHAVEVEIGTPAAIVETGTANTSGTVTTRIEPDATTIVVCEVYLSPANIFNWCPGEEPESFDVGVTFKRTDGLPFDPLFNADWLRDDGIVGTTTPKTDYQPFPRSDCNPYEDPCDPEEWPSAQWDPAQISVTLTMLPAGALAGMVGAGTVVVDPTQLSAGVDPDYAPYRGIALATGPWTSIAGSFALQVSGRICEKVTLCEDCLAAYAATRALGAAGWTMRYDATSGSSGSTIAEVPIDAFNSVCQVFGSSSDGATTSRRMLVPYCPAGAASWSWAWQWSYEATLDGSVTASGSGLGLSYPATYFPSPFVEPLTIPGNPFDCEYGWIIAAGTAGSGGFDGDCNDCGGEGPPGSSFSEVWTTTHPTPAVASIACPDTPIPTAGTRLDSYAAESCDATGCIYYTAGFPQFTCGQTTGESYWTKAWSWA